jgi:hypothetical protein
MSDLVKTKEKPDYDCLQKNMQEVFNISIVKAQLACDKKGNTDTPWKDFSIDWLQKRLEDELNEYYSTKKTGKIDWQELPDVINIACFLYLAHRDDWVKRSSKILHQGRF